MNTDGMRGPGPTIPWAFASVERHKPYSQHQRHGTPEDASLMWWIAGGRRSVRCNVYVVKLKDGPRNRYRIQAHLPLREAITQERTIGEVLDILVESKVPS
jgi:hypothetical protein